MSDLIDRQAAIKDAESWVAVDEYEKHLQKNVVEWLKEFPPAEPSLQDWQKIVLRTLISERKTGKWIEEPNCMYRCSCCKAHYPSIRGYMDYNFCPNCGARMEVDNET